MPVPAHLWIKDDFLVDERTDSGEQALLEVIANRVAHHFKLDYRGIETIIQAELEGKFLLEHEHGTSGVTQLLIEVYRDQSTRKLFATAERKRMFEVRRFACGKPQHASLWVRDEAVSAVISDIAAATSELFIAEVQDRIADRFQLGEDMTLSRSDHRCLLAPFEIERVGIEDGFERLEIWIDVV